MINLQQAIEAIKLFCPESSSGKVVLKTWGKVQKAFVMEGTEHLESVLKLCEENGYDLGFGPALRRPEFISTRIRDGKTIQSQGEKKDCYAIQVLKADFDSVKVNHVKAPLSPNSKKNIAGAIKTHLPSAIVDSGGGLHAYFRINEPYLLETNTQIQFIENLNKQLLNSLKRLNLPCEIDMAITDVSRIMRIPGSVNFRYGSPLPVKILEVFE